ncbi:MAG: hypothetical protein ABI649_01470 [Gaiellaceae bacterium]
MRGALAAVGVLALLASGCGGDGGGRLSQSEFQSRANAICAKYQKQLDALQEPQSLDEIPDLVDQALAIIDQEIEEIAALNPPAELQSDFDLMIEQAEKTKKAADDLSEGAKANDQAAVQKALDEGNTASDDADRIAGELGLDSCKG